MRIGCSGPFGKDATPGSVTRAFGRVEYWDHASVDDEDPPLKTSFSMLFRDFDHSQGEVSILWGDRLYDDPKEVEQRMVVIHDSGLEDKYEKHPTAYLWQTANGLSMGMTVAEIEKLNGRPFLIDYQYNPYPMVKGWEGGALDVADGGCTNRIGLRPKKPNHDLAHGVYRSDDPVVRDLDARIEAILIDYPEDVAEHAPK